MSAIDLFGLDATSEIPHGPALAVGAHFQMRYLTRYTAGKVVQRQELLDAIRTGTYLGVVFEDGARNALGGYAEGKADAEFAHRQAWDVLGRPTGNPIIPLAVDFDGTWSEVRAYFEGAAAVLGRQGCGPYGSYGVCREAWAEGYRGIWQTYAWSGGAVFEEAPLFQYSNGHVIGGVGCDFNKARTLQAFWNGARPDVDPRYAMYYVGPFKWGKFPRMNERAIVQQYDQYRAMQTRLNHPHRQALGILKAECYALAERIAFEAHSSGSPVWGDGNWTAFHREPRYQALLARSRGELVLHP